MLGEYITVSSHEGISLWVYVGGKNCALVWYDNKLEEEVLRKKGFRQHKEWPDYGPEMMRTSFNDYGFIPAELW